MQTLLADRTKIQDRLRWITAIGLMAILLSQMSVQAFEGLGGYLSEFLIARSGVADSSLVIEPAEGSNGIIDIGMGPVVVTLPASGVNMNGGTTATLRGNLSSLNGFSNADIHFEWGYNTSYGNTTTTQTLNAIGDFSSTIAGFSNTQAVYYRAVATADGTNYGASQQFGPVQSNPFRFAILLAVGLGLVVLIAMFAAALGGGFSIAGMVMAAIIGLLGTIAIVFLVNIVLSLW